MTAPIVLFGGSFNPPHLAHLALAQAARRAVPDGELRWLPAGRPWQKWAALGPSGGDPAQCLADGVDRAAMVAALIQDQPGMCLDERELRRPGASYTVDTVKELRRERPQSELILLIGQDQLARLHTWHQPATLLAETTLAVAAREGQAPRMPAPLADLPHRLRVLPMPRMDISSSQIRQRVAAGQSVSTLVGASVARYIEQRHLYRAAPGI